MYGIHTTSFEIETEELLIFIDAGSGLANTPQIGAELQARKPMHIFLTHLHLDHLIGLPAFEPLYDQHQTIHIYGSSQEHGAWRNHLHSILNPPFWPIPVNDMQATIQFHDLSYRADELRLGDITMQWQPIPHTGDCVSYRINTSHRSICIATDHEPTPESMTSFRKFAKGADVFVHDAQYTPAEYVAKRGWGHTTWETASRIAADAGVAQLLLTHHDANREDREIDSFVLHAREHFPNTFAAREERSY